MTAELACEEILSAPTKAYDQAHVRYGPTSLMVGQFAVPTAAAAALKINPKAGHCFRV
jgi:hypothetical protein